MTTTTTRTAVQNPLENAVIVEGSDLFGEPIYIYTRQQAIEDGVLIDLSEWASATKGFLGGFKCPVAVTAAVWNDVENIPPSKQGFQDVRGRAHDVLFMASLYARRNPNADRVYFKVIMHVGRKVYQYYTMTIAPGDSGEPVVTIMRQNED